MSAAAIQLHDLKTRIDGWANLVTGLGTVGRDKREHTYVTSPEELQRARLDAIYRGDAIGARIVDVPARDMLRAWFQIDIASTDDEANAITPEDAARWASGAQSKLDDLRARREVGRALKWRNLYGGSVVVIGAADGSELSKPVNLNLLQDIKWLRAMTCYQVKPGEKVDDPDSEFFGQPDLYKIEGLSADGSEEVHASRVLRFDGVDLAEGSASAISGGWGDPILLRCYSALRDFHAGYDSACQLMQDFAQTVWGLPGLHELIAADREDLVQQRIGIQDFCRSTINAVMVDAGLGETFERKPTPVTGLPELLDRQAIKLSAASGMALTLLLGIAPKGWANEDKSGQENWDDVIASMQEEDLRHPLDHLIELIFASKEGPSKGRVPETWSITFNPLKQQTEKENAETRKTMADADAVYLDRDVISSDEVAASRFGADGFSTETYLDIEAREEFSETEGERDLTAELEAVKAELAALKAPPPGVPEAPPAPSAPEPGEEPAE